MRKQHKWLRGLFWAALFCLTALPVFAQQPDTLFSLKSPFEEFDGQFGISVSGAGDVNMDGKADVIVGARREDPGSSPDRAGRAYVFSGASGDTLFSLKSPFEECGSRFGTSVSGAGDVNMDGKADVIVGTDGESPGSSPDGAGRAYVFSGATGDTLFSLKSPFEESFGFFGNSVSGAGDVSMDGKAEVIVGAAFEDPGSSPDFAGRAYVFAFPLADLKVFKSDGPDPIVLGDTLTYTICVVNSGPDPARSVTVNDTLPAGVSLLTAFPDQGSCSAVGDTISCGLGDIGEGDTVKVSIEVMVDQTGVISNTACVESETADPDDGNNCASAATLVVAGQVLVNDKISPMSLLPTFTPGANTFQFLLNMTNTSSDTIFAPVSVSIDTLTPSPAPPPPDVEVDNADNSVRVEGAVFVYSDTLGGDGKWAPGETTGDKLWKFKLSAVFNFTFFANVFGVLPPTASPVAKSGGDSNAPFVFVVSPENGTLEIHQGRPTSVPSDPLPETFGLQQNYPNPFNPETVIRYQLPQESQVKLSIHNLLGQEIRTLVNEKKDAGQYDVIWDGRDNAGQQVASGVYLYRLRAGEFAEIKKLTLLR